MWTMLLLQKEETLPKLNIEGASNNTEINFGNFAVPVIFNCDELQTRSFYTSTYID